MERIDLRLIDYYEKPEYFFKYLDLRFKYGRIRRKDILSKAKVYQSAFSKAKQNNYINSGILKYKFEQYYNLDSLEYSILEELEQDVYEFVMSIYYLNLELLTKSYSKIKEKEQWFSTTYIAIIFKLFDLMYEVSKTDESEMNGSLIRKYREVAAYYDLLVPSLQLLFIYVGFTLKEHDMNSLNQDIGIMEQKLVSYPILRGCGLYRVACGFRKINVYNASIQYYLESLNCVLEDVNVNRIILIEKQLFDLYCKIGALHKAYTLGKKLLFCINQTTHTMMYNSICFELSLLCVQLEYIQEALYYCKFLDFEGIKEYKALYMVIQYKLKDYTYITNLHEFNSDIIDIHEKVMDYIYEKVVQSCSKKELRTRYTELVALAKKNANSSVYKYIGQLK